MIPPAAAYRPRAADAVLERLLASLPAVLVVGPRAAGKTTTARALAAEILRLDRPADAAAVAADPDAALVGRAEPLLIDEWQEVPEILGAVKRAVDDDSRPGRFLLTGSARAPLQQSMWPGTGRVVQLPLHPLTQRELVGRTEGRPFIERLVGGELLAGGRSDLTVNDYVQRAVRGGYPEVVLPKLDDASARAWHLTYLDALVSRDARALSPRSDPQRLRQYVAALALNTAGIPASRTLQESAGITAVTAARYDDLLASLYMSEEVPAWSNNRLKRLMRRSKRYLSDSGMAAAAAGIDASMVRRDGDLLGRLLDTFVAAQLRPEVALTLGEQRLYHLRAQDGRREVDLLVELAGGRVVAIEVKASASPSPRDAAHLMCLRDELGEGFAMGCVLHTGPLPFPMGDRIVAAPISSLWEG